MSDESTQKAGAPGAPAAAGLEGVNPNRLFWGSCLSLISTSVAFGVVTGSMGQFKDAFALTNQEAGWVGGAALWGFTVSIFIFGPLVDALGMGNLLRRFAFPAHFIGPLLMIFARNFEMLFAGALIIALANGTIEAVCNPLVATIFPNNKTAKLNQFHVWFPGGIVIGGLASYFIDMGGIGGASAWKIKLSLVLIPTIIYGIVFIGQKFPATERVQSGVSFGEMIRATLLRPLFIVLFICMSITASLELGPGRWMNEAMGKAMSWAGGNAGILVLVYGSGLMAVLRFFAGPVVHRLSPTGILVCSAVLAGTGLYSLTYLEGPLGIFVAATLFYLGVCYFWPTMLGVTSERVPKGGALALALLGGWGMAVVGLVTVPIMGRIADTAGHEVLDKAKAIEIVAQGAELLPKVKAEGSGDAIRGIDAAIELVNSVNAEMKQTQEAPAISTSKALREIAKYAPDSEPGKSAMEIIKPADEHGNLVSFRRVAMTSIVIIIVFGILFLSDKAKGGYRQNHINE